MDSVRDILYEVCDEGAVFTDHADRIRRAVLLEKINGMELEWDGCRAKTMLSLYSIISVDGDEWMRHERDGWNCGTGGKAGALADYKARIAAALGVEWTEG